MGSVTAPLWEQVEEDLYRLLGVSPTADDAEITAAWHRRARATHPDTGGNATDFRHVNVAFLVLSDPDARRSYDVARVVPAPTPPPLAPMTTPAIANWRWVAAVLVGVVSVVGSALWPWVTVITGCIVGAVVTTRYVRLARRRPGLF